MAIDGNGNAVVVGTTQSTDFPTTSGAIDRTSNGGVVHVFVAKLDPTDSRLEYATDLGGTPTPLRRGTGDTIEFGRAVASTPTATPTSPPRPGRPPPPSRCPPAP